MRPPRLEIPSADCSWGLSVPNRYIYMFILFDNLFLSRSICVVDHTNLCTCWSEGSMSRLWHFMRAQEPCHEIKLCCSGAKRNDIHLQGPVCIAALMFRVTAPHTNAPTTLGTIRITMDFKADMLPEYMLRVICHQRPWVQIAIPTHCIGQA